MLPALAHGRATNRVLSLVAAGSSVASFIEVAGEFVRNDVSIAREIGSELGAPDDAIKAIGFFTGVWGASGSVFPVRHEGITVTVTVNDSAVTVSARPRR